MQLQQNNVQKLVGFYRGEVIKHEENGKCKVFIPGVYPAMYRMTPWSLPSAEQAAPLFGGTYNGNGMFSYPNIGSIVWVFFENCDQNKPVYFAATLAGEFALQDSGQGFNQVRDNVNEGDDDKKKDTTMNGEDSETHMIACGDSKVIIREGGQIEIVCKTTEKNMDTQEEGRDGEEADEDEVTQSVIRIDEDGNITITSTNKIELKSPVIDIDASKLLNMHSQSIVIRGDTLMAAKVPLAYFENEDSFNVKSPTINMDASKGQFFATGKDHPGLYMP